MGGKPAAATSPVDTCDGPVPCWQDQIVAQEQNITTPRQAAGLLNISPSTISRWRAKEKLGAPPGARPSCGPSRTVPGLRGAGKGSPHNTEPGPDQARDAAATDAKQPARPTNENGNAAKPRNDCPPTSEPT